jgi:uncharacterized repeat protein (TIGR01451 family)
MPRGKPRIPFTRLALGIAGVLALACPAAAAADDVVFGSSLNDPANVMPFQHGWDQNVFNTAGPVGVAAPQPGLIKQVSVRGFAGDGQPLEVKFRVIRPTADGRWQAMTTPLIATLPPTDGVHTYTVPDPRAFRVERGDLVGIFQQGYGGAGRRWQIYSSQPGWTMQKVAIDDGFKDNVTSPSPPVNLEGNSTVTYPNVELLLQAVESPDLCPGTDLPQQPCQSKLYLGGKVKKSRKALTYTWTVRNGGPHAAKGVGLSVNLPRGTSVVQSSLPAGCEVVPGPPLAVNCPFGDIVPPQEGNAVDQLSFSVVPRKKTRFFRAVGTIDAPNVDDPQGTAKHLKTVSASTRY